MASDLPLQGVLPAPQNPPCGAPLSPGNAADTTPDLRKQLLRERIRERTIPIHLGHELDHAATIASLPPGVEMAWDIVVVPRAGV